MRIQFHSQCIYIRTVMPHTTYSRNIMCQKSVLDLGELCKYGFDLSGNGGTGASPGTHSYPWNKQTVLDLRPKIPGRSWQKIALSKRPVNQFKPVQQRAYCTDIYTAVSLLYFCSKIQLVLKSESAAYKILGTLLAKFLAGVAKKSQPCMWYILKEGVWRCESWKI